jgi:hypothetical protein
MPGKLIRMRGYDASLSVTDRSSAQMPTPEAVSSFDTNLYASDTIMADTSVAADDNESSSVLSGHSSVGDDGEGSVLGSHDEAAQFEQHVHMDGIQSGPSKIEAEKLPALQAMAFDELLEVLQVSIPQDSTLTTFANHAALIYIQMHGTMKADLGGSLWMNADATARLWVNLHSELNIFRVAANYQAKAGGDWQAHK